MTRPNEKYIQEASRRIAERMVTGEIPNKTLVKEARGIMGKMLYEEGKKDERERVKWAIAKISVDIQLNQELLNKIPLRLNIYQKALADLKKELRLR